MKLSELIASLQEKLGLYGDVETKVWSLELEDFAPICGCYYEERSLILDADCF